METLDMSILVFIMSLIAGLFCSAIYHFKKRKNEL